MNQNDEIWHYCKLNDDSWGAAIFDSGDFTEGYIKPGASITIERADGRRHKRIVKEFDDYEEAYWCRDEETMIYRYSVKLEPNRKPSKKTDWHKEKTARSGKRAQIWKKELYENQGGVCNGCLQWYGMHFMEVDHIEPDLPGDRDVSTNLQLLCKPCNAAKGNRGMDYLLMRLAGR